MRPGAALAGTRDIKAEIRDIPGNTGLLATLTPSNLGENTVKRTIMIVCYMTVNI